MPSGTPLIQILMLLLFSIIFNLLLYSPSLNPFLMPFEESPGPHLPALEFILHCIFHCTQLLNPSIEFFI